MKTRLTVVASVLGLLVITSASDVFAAGRGQGGGGFGKRDGSCLTQKAGAGSATATRPADSRRRDGTFLSTGVTANGSTTRPGHGNGLQDGTRLSTGVTAAPTPAQ